MIQFYNSVKETEEMDSRMTAVQCAMPAAEEYPFLASTALDKINNMIALLNESSESSHDELAERLSFRFSEVIDFILNSDRSEKCPSVRTIGCFNFDVVFGEEEAVSIEALVGHASNMIVELEQSCPQMLFSTSYVHGGESDHFFTL